MPNKIDEVTKIGLFNQVNALKSHLSRMEEKIIELSAEVRILGRQKQVLEHENEIYGGIMERYGIFSKRVVKLKKFTNRPKKPKE